MLDDYNLRGAVCAVRHEADAGEAGVEVFVSDEKVCSFLAVLEHIYL